MDQKLLDALNNLSFALEEISDALKDKKGKKSDTTTALQSGNFSKTIKEIHVGIKSIKKDTQQILKQQKTILELSKKKTSDKKTDAFETDTKKEGSIKKGVTSILLIAAGVLAIGLAFKIVGKVDFLSVVGLGIGIFTVAAAFERIGRMKDLSYRKVLMISAIMPLMGMGIWLASRFLSRVAPMSIGQIITAIGIAGAFYFIAPVITSMMDAMMNTKEITMPGGKKIKTAKFDMARLKSTIVALPILMVAMALGITVSSWVLSGIKPMSLGQIITAIAVAGMFSIAAMGVKGLIHALTEENEVKGAGGFKTKKMDMGKLMKVALFLPIVMMAIALGITLSSYILAGIKPIGLGQAITAILIAAMFAVVSFGISKMLTALSKIKDSDMVQAAIMLPLLLPAIALAITASSWVLGLVKPISFSQFLTGIAISIMFIAFSVTLLILAKANIFGKIGMKDVIMIPLTFIAMATAITASSWILSVSAEITFGRSLEILAFSVVMCIAVIVVAITAKVVTMIGNVDMYIKAGISISILAATIMAASLIIDKGTYKKYPGWKWSLSVGLSLVIFGATAWALMKIGNVATYIQGSVSILILAGTIMLTSHILNAGNYKKYPSFKWSLSVGLALALFGVGAVLLGTQAMNPLFYAGLGVVVLVALSVVAVSHILALGNYKKYPTAKWALSSGLALALFGVGAALLGTQAVNPLFYLGLGVVLLVAGVVVAASHILGKGDYKKYPSAKWGLGVGLALGSFALGAVLLGTQVFNPFFYAGLGEILLVAATIVETSHILAKGNYKKYPSLAWAGGVGLALSAFSLGAVLLGFNVLNPFFYGGLAMIKEVAQNIVETSYILGRGQWDKFPDTKWAVGISNLFKKLDPVFKIISKYNGLFGNFNDIINNMIRISNVMILLSKKFANSASWKYPPMKWGDGIAKNIYKFVGLSNFVSRKLDFFAFSAVKSMAGEMVSTAKVLSRGKEDFSYVMPEKFVKNLSTNMLAYGRLAKDLDKIMTITEKKSISAGLFGFGGSISYTTKRMADMSIINKVASQMVITAAIMAKGAKFMNIDINPNYMKNLSGNILYYAKLSSILRKEQTASNFVKNIFFGDPITNVANGMAKLAQSYDKLAKSLKNFGGAIKGLDGEKLRQFRGMTANIAVLSALDSQMFDNMLRVLETRSSVFAKILNAQAPVVGGNPKRPSVGATKKDKEKDKKGKHGDTHAQMDLLIDLMTLMVSQISSGSTLDEYLQKKLSEKKK